MLRNCLEEDMCLYRPNARWEGQFEWLKTLQGPQLEHYRKSFWSQSLGVRKPFFLIVKQRLHHHMLFGRVSRKIILAHPKTNSSTFSYQTRLELQMGLASMVRWNKKNCLVNTGIKSTPCVQLNILLYFWCCGPIFLLEVLDILFRYMAS